MTSQALQYRVVQKSEIPETPPAHSDLYGQWVALARLLPLLSSSEAVEIELGTLSHSTAVSSLHGAARIAGVKISTMRVGGRMYVFRVAVAGEAKQPKRWKYKCKCCGAEKVGNRPKQKYCPEKECQAERHRQATRRWDAANPRRRRAA